MKKGYEASFLLRFHNHHHRIGIIRQTFKLANAPMRIVFFMLSIFFMSLLKIKCNGKHKHYVNWFPVIIRLD